MELEFKMQEWSYRTLPNKMYELVHSTGDIHKIGTGYLTDAESEMLTILNYLNFGEKTGITESMIAQIDKAIRDSEITSLHGDKDKRTVVEQTKYMLVSEFVEQMTTVVHIPVSVISYKEVGEVADYIVDYYVPDKPKKTKHFNTLIESRKYVETLDLSVRMSNRSDDYAVIETWI